MTDRNSRSAETRDKKTRKKVWQPPSMLDAPDASPGYQHRWVRAEVRGHDDKANMSKRIREGWEPVRAEEYPEFDAPTVEDGKHAGVIGVGGLILARIPIEIVEQRRQYFEQMANDQMEAVDRNLMRESSSVMPIDKPNRQTRVTFGKGGAD